MLAEQNKLGMYASQLFWQRCYVTNHSFLGHTSVSVYFLTWVCGLVGVALLWAAQLWMRVASTPPVVQVHDWRLHLTLGPTLKGSTHLWCPSHARAGPPQRDEWEHYFLRMRFELQCHFCALATAKHRGRVDISGVQSRPSLWLLSGKLWLFAKQ